MKFVIFTDLDGTLLDPVSYSWEAARPALDRIRRKAIPLIICSSKTRGEIEHIRNQMDNPDPFISENGGAIFIPESYFPFSLPFDQKIAGYRVIELGTPYKRLREALKIIAEKAGVVLKGYGDMPPEEIAAQTGLSIEDARLAKQREYDEPFTLTASPKERQRAIQWIEQMGLHWTRGSRYDHLMGGNDKGKAVKRLIALFEQKCGKVTTVGLGDSPNDLPMLAAVNYPVLVQKSDGSYDEDVDLPNLEQTSGIGPVGWNAAILELLKTKGERSPLP